jgi:hypothetical protein
MRSTALALVLLAACGSKTQAPRDLPTLAPDPPKADAGTETPPARLALPGKTTGFTRELIAAVGGRQLFIDEFGSLRLSAAERRRAQQIIADWATAEGLTILSPDLVEAAIARGANGTDASGAACGPPLDRQYSIDRWVVPMGAEGAITARIDCEATCAMQLEVKLFAMGTEFYSAPFDPGQPWEQELTKRLPTVIDNGGHERYGHANNPVAITGVPRKPGTADWYLEDDAFVEGKAAAEAKRCNASDRPIALMLEKADNGALTCETAGAPRYVTEYDAKVNACMCAAAVKLEKPTAKRSYFLYRGPSPDGRVLTTNGKAISANLIGGNEYRPRGSSPWMLRESDSVAPCFVARTQVTKYDEVNATLDFDKSGTVTKATIGDLKGMLKPDERACVTKKLMNIRTPCPDRFAPPGQVRITLEIREKS